MKQKMIITYITGFLFLLIIFAQFHINNQITGNTYLNISEDILQNGDLVFRQGRTAESQAVLLTDRKSSYSHVGIIYIDNKNPYVIHAVPGENINGPDFIKKEKITDFLTPRKAKRFAIYRSDFTNEERKIAATTAFNFYKEQKTFDNKYNLVTDDQLYCTELVIKVFQKAINESLNLSITHLNLVFGTLNVIMPGDIISNPHFNLIINN